ncbi:peptidase S10 [Lichenicola cladoniae]|uniref:Peptidase S10 n=1 Tax=Lichenicola cladoniae TaxID=1484109 RepID=A0A6M8HQI7_9PROT|nr:peptidase S10 [Acetobacteraceae bacterium]QKE90540.1 peptidase S10 [Lichenicola cladoniae]
MKRASLFLTAALLASPIGLARPHLARADDATIKITRSDKDKARPHLTADEKTSDGSVDAGGQHVDYEAVAGTLIVHPKGWDDAAKLDGDSDKAGDKAADDTNPTAEAAMFYVAYFKKGARAENRPITFLYNGGPGSATVWLHMGAFGPRRVVTLDDSHGPAAPYRFINNDQSLLDVSDLVFIDAPGTGFSRIAGKDKEKDFYGIDQDGHAFADFIASFLSKYGRWNSPKYLFGESYGTTRSAVLINQLEQDKSVDFNGVILLSQILSFDASVDGPEMNPGVDLPYIVALPTYAATAWYHHKLPGTPGDLHALLTQVETFASTDYAAALQQGSMLDPAKRDAIAEKLHDYTGLPVDYIKKANLRVDGGEFEKTLQGDETTTGRLDTRFSGPTMDPLSKESDYDPQSAAIGSAYVSVFNDYVRKVLGYGDNKYYKPEIEIDNWDMKHQPPGATSPVSGSANVMPDLATAMKYNPNLKIQLNAGYFDLATPYYEGIYEMHHLPIPQALQANIEYHQYESGHMVYAHQAALQQLHDNVADFIRRTDAQGPGSAPPAAKH